MVGLDEKLTYELELKEGYKAESNSCKVLGIKSIELT